MRGTLAALLLVAAVVTAVIVACRDFDQFRDAATDAGVIEITGPCAPDCPTVDMVTVPAGSYTMGCNDLVDIDCEEHERPGHTVTVKEFMIDRTELTVADYRRCVAAGECLQPDPNDGCTYEAPDHDRFPINCVTWQHADRYCRWVGKRLPTEAEWEKAARGVDGAKYPWGNVPEPSCDYAVMFDESACGVTDTLPVGNRPKGMSPYGLYDTAGNVWEWVADWYAADYYGSGPAADPKGPAVGTNRVLRGGSWGMSYENFLRASARWGKEPAADFGTIGFRCVR